jgi:hypothetical protein
MVAPPQLATIGERMRDYPFMAELSEAYRNSVVRLMARENATEVQLGMKMERRRTGKRHPKPSSQREGLSRAKLPALRNRPCFQIDESITAVQPKRNTRRLRQLERGATMVPRFFMERFPTDPKSQSQIPSPNAPSLSRRGHAAGRSWQGSARQGKEGARATRALFSWAYWPAV